MGKQKHAYAGPIWDNHGTVTMGLGGATVPVNFSTSLNVEFCYVSNADSGTGYVRVNGVAIGGTTTHLGANSGLKAPESGVYFPVSNLKELWFIGETGAETVTINYGL